jgi:hypothetical protein
VTQRGGLKQIMLKMRCSLLAETGFVNLLTYDRNRMKSELRSFIKKGSMGMAPRKVRVVD